MPKHWGLLVTVIGGLALVACGGGAPTAAPAPPAPQPQAPAKPAPAAPAPEPQPGVAPTKPAPAPAPKPAAPAVKEPKHGGLLRLGNRRDPTGSFEPMREITINLHHSAEAIFGTGNLVRPCRESIYKVCPGLAESWEHNPDFTQWTFKVRDGVVWHDGKPFTPEDVKFWADLAFFGAKVGDKTRAPSRFRGAFGALQKVEVLPGNRVRFTLGKRAPLFLESIYDPTYEIAHPKHLMESRIQQGDLGVPPLEVGNIGSGPFKFVKWDKGSLVQVRRFDRYWEKDEKGRGLPYLDGIDYFVFSDPAAMDAAFRTGRLDGGALGDGMYLSKERQAGYIRDLGDQVWFAEIGATRVGFAFNVLNKGPWQDVRVRRAIALWMDKEAAIPSVLGGFGYQFTILHPNSPFTSPDFMTWPGWNKATREKDRAEAKRLLAEAGYASGFKMTHNCRRLWVPRCEFLHSQLAGLGIELDITPVDDAVWNRERLTLRFDSHQAGPAYQTEPEATALDLNRFSISPAAAAKHEDFKVTEFFDRLNAAAAFEERVRIWREFERYYLLEQVYMVPLFGQLAVVPYRSHVKGRVVPAENINSNTDFATVWLDK